MLNDHPLNIGPIGVTKSDSANGIAEQADEILVVGARLQDFTTGSRTAFERDARFISINAARHDADKHMSLPTVGGAKLSLEGLATSMGDEIALPEWVASAQKHRKKWDAYVDDNVSCGDNRPNSYAQAIGVVKAHCDNCDRIVAAAGGLPGEVTANWRTLDIGTVDVEFGFPCMGYEIAGAWGARIARSEREPENETISLCGDGSYLMLNSDIYSSVLTGKKLILLVLNNGGCAVTNKLQNNSGNESFNKLIKDAPTIPEAFCVDFEANAASQGAIAETVANPAELAEAFKRAKAADRTTVIVMKVDPYDGWTPRGHPSWEVGTAHITINDTVRAAQLDQDSDRDKQRKGV